MSEADERAAEKAQAQIDKLVAARKASGLDKPVVASTSDND